MKIAHPEPAFREAAEEACRSIGTMVEKYVLFPFITILGDVVLLIFALGNLSLGLLPAG